MVTWRKASDDPLLHEIYIEQCAIYMYNMIFMLRFDRLSLIPRVHVNYKSSYFSRIFQLFEIIVEFPESLPAIEDLKVITESYCLQFGFTCFA